MIPKTIYDAALRLKAADDKDEVRDNSLLRRGSGAYGAAKAREHLADLRLIYRFLLDEKPSTPFGDAA